MTKFLNFLGRLYGGIKFNITYFFGLFFWFFSLSCSKNMWVIPFSWDNHYMRGRQDVYEC